MALCYFNLLNELKYYNVINYIFVLRNLLLLPALFIILSCSFDSNSFNYKKDTKLFIHNAINNNKSFTFVINDKLSNQDIEVNKKYQNITKKELKILRKLLKRIIIVLMMMATCHLK